MNKKDIDLSIDFCGVKFKNPFLLSSSPVSNSAEMVARSFEAGWSGVVFSRYRGNCGGWSCSSYSFQDILVLFSILHPLPLFPFF